MHDIYQWWKIAPYSYIKDKAFSSFLYDNGYYLDQTLSENSIEQLEKLYHENHRFKVSGMFNSMYAKDVGYRKKMHNQITAILGNYLTTNFQDYKVVYSVFFLKGPATNTFLFTHQDLSLVDEFKYSSIHLWIPLTDITLNNGAVCLIDKSHHLYAPYRGMSFPDPTNNIQTHLASYLKPITVKKGEVLAFDPRTIHCSLPNKTTEVRPVVIAVLAPKEAGVEVCYKGKDSGKIEIIEQAEDFFLASHHFIESSKERPSEGHFKKYVDYLPHYYTEQEFDSLATKFNIEKKNVINELGDMNTDIHRNRNAKKMSLIPKWLKI